MIRMHTDESSIDALWNTMHAEKGDLIPRTENFARLTIPYVCPRDTTENSEQEQGSVMIAARLVNHLANKVVDTMFPKDRPFFTVSLTPEAKEEVKQELGEDNAAQFAENIRNATVSMETAAVRTMNLVAYRPQAVEAIKHLIISGNVVIRRLKDGRRIVYGVKDFCMRRDVTGDERECILRDAKTLADLPKALQQRYLNKHPTTKPEEPLTLYSHYKLEDGRWHFRQAINDVVVDNGTKYNPVEVPFLSLTWNLARGSNYARGLVEDQIVPFHTIDVTTLALIDIIGVMADLKFLVDPGSVVDVAELNNSPRGSYHQGRKDDISTPEKGRNLEIGLLSQTIDKWERDLSQAFLLNSGAIRDAERVTAEEIRYVANELEAAFGGLYSRLAIGWQKREADYAITQIDFKRDVEGNFSMFEVVITTGLESLSREGQLSNLRGAISDLTMLDAVPEEVRAVLNPLKFASFVFTNHTVNFQEFLYSKDEIEANKQADMEMAGRQMQMEGNAKVQQAAGEAAVKETT